MSFLSTSQLSRRMDITCSGAADRDLQGVSETSIQGGKPAFQSPWQKVGGQTGRTAGGGWHSHRSSAQHANGLGDGPEEVSEDLEPCRLKSPSGQRHEDTGIHCPDASGQWHNLSC